jgi:hypothetical protein
MPEHWKSSFQEHCKKLIPRTLQKAHSKNIAKLAHKKTI